ncbi:hypothetical protein ACFE04_022765 [Oxalis oulophora]
MAIGHLDYWLCKTCPGSTKYLKIQPETSKKTAQQPVSKSQVVVIEETKMTTTTYYRMSTSSDWQDSAQTGCANQNFQDQPGPKNLNILLTTLTQQSSQKSFCTATAGDGATTVTRSCGNGTVYVLSQCEGDLSSGDCGDCVKIGFDSVKSQCGGGGNNNVGSAQIYKTVINERLTDEPRSFLLDNLWI